MTVARSNWNQENASTKAIVRSLVLFGFLAGTAITSMAQESSEYSGIEIVHNIYSSMNDSELEELVNYLAEDIEMSSIQGLSPPVIGKDAVLAGLQQMLAVAKESVFKFRTGPFAMGDVVTVEYTHQYEIEGDSRQDHNVSVFVFENQKVVKWLGYIHQN